MDDVHGANTQAMQFWDEVIEDMESTAAEYESAGWDTVQLHPGDVTALATGDDQDRFGLDVLVPDDEFAAVEELLDDGVEFDAYEVFRGAAGGLVLAVVAMEANESGVAVLYPVYYDVQAAEPMLADARDHGKLYSYVRTLSEDRIEFVHEDPSLFAPDSDGDGGGE